MKYISEVNLTSAEKAALIALTVMLAFGVMIIHVRHHYFRPRITIAREVFGKELTAADVETYLREQRSISLNDADVAALVTVPGIGEKTAKKIIEYRENIGPFTSGTDLLRIRGIGEKKLEKILPYVKI
jgi:competence ComEA-like helix-hairpin-helix protein